MMRMLCKAAAALVPLLSLTGCGGPAPLPPPAAVRPTVPRRAAKPPAASIPSDPTVVATVNGQPIRMDTLVAELISQHGREALDQIIRRVVLQQELERSGEKISQRDIETELAREREFLKRIYGPDISLEDHVREQAHMTMDEYRRYLVPLYILARRRTAPKVNPTEGEVARYFAEHHQRYDVSDRVRVSHILVAASDAQGRPRSEQELMSRIEEVRKAVAGGVSFADAARKYSEDRNTSFKGGDLGFLDAVSCPPALTRLVETALRLKAGKVGAPVVTAFGAHLVAVTDRIPGRQADFSEVRKVVRQDCIQEQVDLESELWARDLLNKADIKVFLPEGARGQAERHE